MTFMRPSYAFVKRIHWIAFALISAILASKPGSGAEKPKLILAVVVDQFRYDYLTRFRADYHDGFDRLLKGQSSRMRTIFTSPPLPPSATRPFLAVRLPRSAASSAMNGTIAGSSTPSPACRMKTRNCSEVSRAPSVLRRAACW